MSTTTESASANKRTFAQSNDTSAIEPTPKFSKSNTSSKVVPNVVAVDFGSEQTTQAAQQQQQQTTGTGGAEQKVQKTFATAGSEQAVATSLDYKKINNREALERVLRVQKFNKKNAAYIAVDVRAYKEITGISVKLDQYNHLSVKGPMMANIFGISSRTVQGKTTHSINYGISDCSADTDVLEFANFLALLDNVLIDKCVDLVLESADIRNAVDWVEESKDDETGKINKKKLRRKVAKNFNGALRTSKKAMQDPEFRPVEMVSENKANIPDCFWFRTKIRANSSCDQLLDLMCFTDDEPPQMVFYNEIKELYNARETYVKPQLEMPAIYFTQKELWATWVTRKIKVQIKNLHAGGDEPQAAVDDFGSNGAPVVFSQADCDAVRRQEEALRAQIENGSIIAGQTVTEGDDGGF